MCRYDLKHNQVVLYSDKCSSQDKVTSVLAHELVHMYDHCVARLDWDNILHLACSEVRAYSLAHCTGPIAAALQDGGSWTAVSRQHGECVRRVLHFTSKFKTVKLLFDLHFQFFHLI